MNSQREELASGYEERIKKLKELIADQRAEIERLKALMIEVVKSLKEVGDECDN